MGSRSKTSTQTLEDTITKNNIEAVKEVVRQLRLRDIGGIIVIDFIDMANPKNRANVEEALRQELERDRTKTYVVEISPLGLVEMTRQNVTDGPREILAKKCPVCAGDGIVVSEQTAAVDLEQRLRSLVKGSRNKVFRVEVNAHVASILIGPGARRLSALEEASKRRFVIETRDDVPHDHMEVLAQGAAAEPEPGPVAEGSDVSLKLVEIGLHDGRAGVGKLNGLAIVVAGGGSLIGKKVQARVERVMGGVAYATLVSPAPRIDDPITAEAEAERPTRARRTKAKTAVAESATPEAEADEVAEQLDDEVDVVAEEPVAAVEPEDGETPAGTPKKKTRRGTRGGRNRKRKPAAATVNGDAPEKVEEPEPELEPQADAGEPQAEEKPTPKPKPRTRRAAPARIHLPPDTLGEELKPAASVNGGEPPVDAVADEAEPAAEAAADGDEQPKPKKKTRRGTRGGRNRKRKPAAAAQAADAAAEPSTGE